MGNLTQEELAKRAMESKPEPRRSFGQVVDTRFTMVSWDSESRQWVDDDNSRTMKIEIFTRCQKKDGTTWDNTIVLYDTPGLNKWKSWTRKSLEVLHVGAVELKDKFFEIVQKETGDTYLKRGKPDLPENYVADTAHWFVRFFPDENAMVSAYVESMGYPTESSADGDGSATIQADNGEPKPAVVAAAKSLFSMYGSDLEVFKQRVQGNSVVWSGFHQNMDAVLAAVGAANSEENVENLPF